MDDAKPPEAAMSPGEYEFTPRENEIIRSLSRDMSWVAFPLVFVGILYGVGFVSAVIRAFQDPSHFLMPAMLLGLAMLFYLVLGIWTNRAAASFGLVVTTQGRDVSHVMSALDELRKTYGLLSAFVKVYVAFALIGVIIGLIAMFTTLFR